MLQVGRSRLSSGVTQTHGHHHFFQVAFSNVFSEPYSPMGALCSWLANSESPRAPRGTVGNGGQQCSPATFCCTWHTGTSSAVHGPGLCFCCKRNKPHFRAGAARHTKRNTLAALWVPFHVLGVSQPAPGTAQPAALVLITAPFLSLFTEPL